MSPVEATKTLRSRSDEISAIVTAMHPVVRDLGNSATQAEVLRALFELTKQVEVVKKHLIRLEKGDNSIVL